MRRWHKGSPYNLAPRDSTGTPTPDGVPPFLQQPVGDGRGGRRGQAGQIQARLPSCARTSGIGHAFEQRHHPSPSKVDFLIWMAPGRRRSSLSPMHHHSARGMVCGRLQRPRFFLRPAVRGGDDLSPECLAPRWARQAPAICWPRDDRYRAIRAGSPTARPGLPRPSCSAGGSGVGGKHSEVGAGAWRSRYQVLLAGKGREPFRSFGATAGFRARGKGDHVWQVGHGAAPAGGP